MWPIAWDWMSLAIRWVHIITGIAWIGSSFYFIALDLSLKKHKGLPEGVGGDTWQVHGGGFYHMQKYTVAPTSMPEELTWFKWESYATWISGFFMICVLYYGSSELFLIDRNVADLSQWQAIGLGFGGMLLGWVLYDQLCKSPIGKNDNLLSILVFIFVVAIGWGFLQVFSGRGAFVHTGALIATIMSANVIMIIIPNQKKTVASLLAGEAPDPSLGLQAKQRSMHNNYLTLPVLFLMLSNHYPLAYATKYAWIIIALVLVIGVVIRHFFNMHHAKKGEPFWTWLVATICFILIMWLSQAGPVNHEEAASSTHAPTVIEEKLASAENFEMVRDIVLGRCSMCHAQEPGWEGIPFPPKSVVLEEDKDIIRHAELIYKQAAITNAMPPGNLSFITMEERAVLAKWYEEAIGSPRHFLW